MSIVLLFKNNNKAYICLNYHSTHTLISIIVKSVFKLLIVFNYFFLNLYKLISNQYHHL